MSPPGSVICDYSCYMEIVKETVTGNLGNHIKQILYMIYYEQYIYIYIYIYIYLYILYGIILYIAWR